MLILAQTDGMGWFGWFWMMILLGLGMFMILLVLLQRGRGGGLVGALGGAGGQSAFGTRAGDVFTRITIVVATLWVATAGIGGIALRGAATSGSAGLAEEDPSAGLGIPGAPGLETAAPIDIGTLGGEGEMTEGDGDESATPALPDLPGPDSGAEKPEEGESGDAKPAEADAAGDTKMEVPAKPSEEKTPVAEAADEKTPESPAETESTEDKPEEKAESTEETKAE